MATRADSVWSTIGSISTAVGVIVAIAAVIVTLVLTLRSEKLTRQGQELEREQAETTAARSEAAAALTEEYTRRVVTALESIAQSGSTGVPATAPKVAWSMERDTGATFRLTNIGDAKAFNVRLTSDETLQLLGFSGGPDLDNGEAMNFIASVSFGTRDRTITVTWDSDDGGSPGGTWRYPLPPI